MVQVGKKILVAVDPFSSGAVLVHRVCKNDDWVVVRVLSGKFSEEQLSFVPAGLTISYLESIQHDGPPSGAALEKTLSDIRRLPFPVGGVIAACETGVELSDALSQSLGVLTNGTELSACRRDKFLMGDRVRQCGIRAAEQMHVDDTTAKDVVEAFVGRLLATSSVPKVVVKPLRSCGGDDVVVCGTVEEVHRCVEYITGKCNMYGIPNAGVVVQEYLDGVEFVVDTVSRNGVHKILALWEYDKRMVNGSPFVYFGMRLVDSDAPGMQALMEYYQTVLDALGVANGPTHGEVKMCNGTPYLVEIGARFHGVRGSFSAIVDSCIGYNQIDAAFDVIASPERFTALPAAPKLKRHTVQAFLVSLGGGMLRSLNYEAVLRSLSSFFIESSVLPEKGSRLSSTINGWTSPGYVSLVSTSEATVLEDYYRLLILQGLKPHNTWHRNTMVDFEASLCNKCVGVDCCYSPIFCVC